MVSSKLTPSSPHPFFSGAPEADGAIQVESHECRVEGKNHLPWPESLCLLNRVSFDAAQGMAYGVEPLWWKW